MPNRLAFFEHVRETSSHGKEWGGNNGEMAEKKSNGSHAAYYLFPGEGSKSCLYALNMSERQSPHLYNERFIWVGILK